MKAAAEAAFRNIGLWKLLLQKSGTELSEGEKEFCGPNDFGKPNGREFRNPNSPRSLSLTRWLQT